MKRTLLTALTIALAAATSAAASDRATSPTGATVATLTIKPEPGGCQSWALDNNSNRLSQTIRLREGQAITVVNHDSVSQTLITTSSGQLAISQLDMAISSPETQSLRIPIDPGITTPPPAAPTMPEAEMAPGAAIRVTFLEAGSHTLTLRADRRCHASTSGPTAGQLSLHALVYPQLHHPLP